MNNPVKKLLGLILAILLLVGSACAEDMTTRERTIVLEGYEETITETLYKSPKGFSLWYPAEVFSAKFEDDFDQFDSIIPDIDMGIAIIDAEMSYEAADELLDAEIELSIANGGEVPAGIEEWDLESGMHVKYAEIIYGDKYNPACYLYGNNRVFSISYYYPSEAAEGFGRRILQMISTFELIEE